MSTPSLPPFFWLHVKKSAGITARNLLAPYYIETDRSKRPKNFAQASPAEYNDILNNYRVVLGEYQFRRCLFAKQFLYKEDWEKLFSFAFAREPVDRCISMFYYLCWDEAGVWKNVTQSVKLSLANRRAIYNTATAFDLFLEQAAEARTSHSIYLPNSLHFTTHTAPMWDDIVDEEGRLLLKAVFRLENLTQGINHVYEACGMDKRVADAGVRLNKNKRRGLYEPTKEQRLKIEQIYGRDFELYENAGS